MLRSYDPWKYPDDSSITYFAATFDRNGAQALLWSAMDYAFTGEAGTQEQEAAEYFIDVDIIPDTVTDEVTLVGREFDWMLAESLLNRLGDKAIRLSAAAKTTKPEGELIVPWSHDMAEELHFVGVRAMGLAIELKHKRASM